MGEGRVQVGLFFFSFFFCSDASKHLLREKGKKRGVEKIQAGWGGNGEGERFFFFILYIFIHFSLYYI